MALATYAALIEQPGARVRRKTWDLVAMPDAERDNLDWAFQNKIWNGLGLEFEPAEWVAFRTGLFDETLVMEYRG